MNQYRVELPVFNGPLDLLLHLIEREELDITAVSLVQVTGQYLSQVRQLGEEQMEHLIDFISIGARLVLWYETGMDWSLARPRTVFASALAMTLVAAWMFSRLPRLYAALSFPRCLSSGGECVGISFRGALWGLTAMTIDIYSPVQRRKAAKLQNQTGAKPIRGIIDFEEALSTW